MTKQECSDTRGEKLPANARLSAEQRRHYQERGYYFPVRVFEDAEASELRAHFLEYWAQNQQRLRGLPPREHYMVTTGTHLKLRWAYGMVSQPRILDAVESILGPNLIVWGSQWFAKMPGDKTFVSWHQDATYWGLHPPQVTTAWIALSECGPENGCLRVIPGTHLGSLLPQVDTYARDNALSRGQEIAVEVDESQAVELVLHPGEISLHHVGIVHGSNANMSSKPRIGCAVRFITPEVVQDGAARQIAQLVRGRDEFGHFDLVAPPEKDTASSEDEAIHQEALRRMRSTIMPKRTS